MIFFWLVIGIIATRPDLKGTLEMSAGIFVTAIGVIVYVSFRILSSWRPW